MRYYTTSNMLTVFLSKCVVIYSHPGARNISSVVFVAHNFGGDRDYSTSLKLNQLFMVTNVGFTAEIDFGLQDGAMCLTNEGRTSWLLPGTSRRNCFQLWKMYRN